jgi:hypothetical protein
MKHFAIRSKSMRKGDRPFTTPGLGDRVHSAMLGYLYALDQNEPVTIHLTSDKDDKPHKQQSWGEIMTLFPEGMLTYKVHDVANLRESEWLEYLRDYDAVTYYYKDTEQYHPNDPPSDVPTENLIDISALINRGYPLLKGNDAYRMLLPDKFITTQWDTNDKGRQMQDVNAILNNYRAQGVAVLIVGGKAEIPDLKEIGWIGYTMSRAVAHVGIDSAMLHMASLYMKPENIHVYNDGGFTSHHLIRGVNNGMKLNAYAYG